MLTDTRSTMAIKTIQQITDDIDGSDGAETVNFSFEGTNYAIDLSENHREAFKESLAEWIGHARKVTGSGSAYTARRSSGSSSSANSGEAKAIRAWAAENNVDVPARGRIPGSVIEQYKASQN